MLHPFLPEIKPFSVTFVLVGAYSYKGVLLVQRRSVAEYNNAASAESRLAQSTRRSHCRPPEVHAAWCERRYDSERGDSGEVLRSSSVIALSHLPSPSELGLERQLCIPVCQILYPASQVFGATFDQRFGIESVVSDLFFNHSYDVLHFPYVRTNRILGLDEHLYESRPPSPPVFDRQT